MLIGNTHFAASNSQSSTKPSITSPPAVSPNGLARKFRQLPEKSAICPKTPQIRAFYGQGPPAHVIPDCLVALDVDAEAIWNRVGYDPIQNGKPPDLVIEVASRSTYRNDATRKREIYRQIAVPEYWRFDPTGGDFHGQPIIGEHLVNGQYEPFPVIRYDDGSEGATSAVLNLNFRWREQRFWIHNPATGAEYEHPQETIARLQEENRRLRGEG